MIPVSNAWVQMMNVRTNYLPSASILLAGGSTITVDMDDIVGLKLGESGGGGALPVGFAICRTCELELDNADGRFDDVVFAGAEVTVSLSYNTGSATETVLMGTYTVKQPGTSGTSIILPCEDDMAKADKLFETTLTAPTTAGALWADICTSCGITGQQTIPQASYAIQTLPSGEISYRQVLGDIAMLSGGNARVDRDRTLKVVNYDFATLEDARDEGTVPAGMHNLALWKTLSNDTEDITITGVSTTKEGSDGGFDIVTVGTDDNVLTVSNSIIAGNELAAMTSLGAAINGAVYRPFNGEHVSYPIAEFGDIAHVTDGLGIEFYTVITDIAWEAWNVTTLTASAEVNEGTGAGTLSQRMSKVTADIAEIKRLKVDWADIDTAVINTLETNDITAKNLTVIDDDGNVVATYSGNVVIGKDDETHLEIDFNSLKLIDKEGNTYFYVSDLRDETGYAEITNQFTGDGQTTAFRFSVPRSQMVSVTIDGVEVSSSDYTTTRNYITFTTAPADSASIVVVYKSNSPYLKAFSFGQRNSAVGLFGYAEGSNVRASGDVSHAEGADTTASGEASHAEGGMTTASGGQLAYSHAEGYKTTASGKYGSHAEGWWTTASAEASHAEGYRTTASGGRSHAEGYFTIARGSDQHASGRYNIEDSNNTYAEIVGNGTSDPNRSNARTLDWNGNEVLAGNLTINGSTDVGAILTALTADSDWISLNPIYYRKVGRTVFITCSSTTSAVSSLPANTWTTVCTIPDGYRPSRRIDSAAVFGYNADVAGDVRISATGVVEVWPSAAVSQPYIYFSTSYPV